MLITIALLITVTVLITTYPYLLGRFPLGLCLLSALTSLSYCLHLSVMKLRCFKNCLCFRCLNGSDRLPILGKNVVGDFEARKLKTKSKKKGGGRYTGKRSKMEMDLVAFIVAPRIFCRLETHFYISWRTFKISYV